MPDVRKAPSSPVSGDEETQGSRHEVPRLDLTLRAFEGAGWRACGPRAGLGQRSSPHQEGSVAWGRAGSRPSGPTHLLGMVLCTAVWWL